LLAAAVLATLVTGVVGYAQHGRPDWPAVARAVTQLQGADAAVVTTNQWTQISLGYYLGRYRGLREAPSGITTVLGDAGRLRVEVARLRGGCVLVVDAGLPAASGLFAGLRPKHPVLSLPDTNGARLFQFAGQETPRQACFPAADFALEPSPGYGSLLPWLARRGAAHG
jgi:hypothetical protein